MYSFYKNYSYLAYRHTIMVKHDDISLKEASKKIPMDTTSMILGEIYSIMEFFCESFHWKSCASECHQLSSARPSSQPPLWMTFSRWCRGKSCRDRFGWVVPYDFFRLKRDFFLTAKVKVAESLKDMGVSKNRGTPKSSILIGFSIINHPFGIPLFFGNTHMMIYFQLL